MLESAAGETFEPIFGDKLRLHALNATSAPLVSHLIEQVRVGVRVRIRARARVWVSHVGTSSSTL